MTNPVNTAHADALLAALCGSGTRSGETATMESSKGGDMSSKATTVTLDDLMESPGLDVTVDAALVVIGDSEAPGTWWAKREDWDAYVEAHGEREHTSLERAYEHLCSIVSAVWESDGFAGVAPSRLDRRGEGDPICEDDPCAQCGEMPVYRECECGNWGWVTDCGHMDQPRPLACNGIHGQDPSCEDCEEQALEDPKTGQIQ